DGEVLEPGVAERDGGLGGEGPHQRFILRVERHDTAAVERIDQLEHAEDIVRGILERYHQDRLRAIAEARVDTLIEGIRPVRRDHVRIVQVEDIARERDVAGEAQLAQMQGLSLETATHLLLAQLLGESVVLHDGEAQQVTLAEEQRAGLGPCEAARFGQDALEQRAQVLLAGQRDPDLYQLPERLSQVQLRDTSWLVRSA